MDWKGNENTLNRTHGSEHMECNQDVNCIKTYSDGVPLELLSFLIYANHLRSSNVFIQLTHSMLPLSLLILGCYTCSFYRWSLDGTSIATYEGYMSRDNVYINRM